MSATALVNPESFIAVSILLPELAATPRPPQVSRVRARPQKNNRYASPPPRTPPAISRSRKNQRNPTSIETCSGRRRSSPANTSWTRTVTRSAHPVREPCPARRVFMFPRPYLTPGSPACPAPRTQLGRLQRLPVFQDRFDVAQPSRLRAVCDPVAPPTPGSASRSVLSQARVVGFAARHSAAGCRFMWIAEVASAALGAAGVGEGLDGTNDARDISSDRRDLRRGRTLR